MEYQNANNPKPGKANADSVATLGKVARRPGAGQSRALLDFALDHVREAAFLIDEQARFHYVNAEACRTLGYKREALLGLRVADVDPDFPAEQWPEHWSDLRAHGSLTFEGRHRSSDGHVFPVEITANYFEFEGSAYNLALVRDITERKQAEAELYMRGQEFRALAEYSPEVIVRYDRECRRVYVNPAHQKSTGLSPAEVLGKSPTELWGLPFDPAHYQANIKQVIHTGATSEFEYEWLSPDGRKTYVLQRIVPEYDRNGQVVGALAYAYDLTEFKHMEELIHAKELEFRTLVENSPDTISRYDRDCRRIYANPKLVEELGGNLSQILGTTPSEFPGGDAAVLYQEKIREVLTHGGEQHFELAWRAGEREICSHIRMSAELDLAGQVVRVLAVGRDITEIHQYRQKIRHLAMFDPLTTLPNRTLLSDRIRQTIADAAYHGHQFGLMLLDLDHFKEINDTLGHGVGDLLLCEAARRLQGSVRGYDTVARLGGDEFAILLPEIRASDDLGTIAGKILESLAEPFNIGGKELYVSCSLGIALYPGDSAEIDALFKYADSAMYHAKNQGRNNFQFYAKELTARASERLGLETALRKALGKGELELYYQPQIDLLTGHVAGAEALLRWNRHEHGMVMPDRFITIAEESGLIVEMGEWVLSAACQSAVDWNRSRQTPLTVAVNLSTRQFVRNDLVGAVRRILAETGCRPEWLKLEITESLLLEDNEQVAAMLEAFHEMGLSLSIDDFGTGYSALSYLNRFPVSQLKIDRSFVRDIPADHDKSELVKAMLSIAVALRLEVVAEGVETHAQVEYLTVHGCRLVQGYLFGKPMARAEFERNMLNKTG